MLFNDNVLFIHVPKAGGMSVTHYLVNNLSGQLHLTLPRGAFEHARRSACFDDIGDRLDLIAGRRHEDLGQAERVLASYGRKMSDFRLILALMRNPYDLEVSYYRHLRKAGIRARSKETRPESILASSGDFDAFAERAPYFGHLPSRIERFYLVKGRALPNMKVIKLEEVAKAIELLAPFSFGRSRMPHKNPTRASGGWRGYATKRSEPAIYYKYSYLFSFYERDRDIYRDAPAQENKTRNRESCIES